MCRSSASLAVAASGKQDGQVDKQDAEALAAEIRNLRIGAGLCRQGTRPPTRPAPAPSGLAVLSSPRGELTSGGCLHDVRVTGTGDDYAVAVVFHQRHRDTWGPIVGHSQVDLNSLVTSGPTSPSQLALEIYHSVIEEPQGFPEVPPDEEGIRWLPD